MMRNARVRTTGFRRVQSFFAAAVLALIAISLAPTQGLAQFNTGIISGVVTDPNGALIPNAAVTITNQNTALTVNAKTNSTGNYSAPALPYGKYIVAATAEGFGTATSQVVELAVGGSVSVNLALALSSTSEQITVTGTTSTVNTTGTEVGTNLNTAQVSNLPVNGRDVMGLLAVVPGSSQSNGIFQTSVNGMETSFTGLNTLLDGADATRIDTNAATLTMGSQQSRVTRASIESVQEVVVLNTGYKAEYGRSLGPIVNIITRSGTNEFHGSLFDYFRNEALNSRNFFEATPNKQPFKMNQFGGNLGGPILRDKLFFFTNYEGTRQHITNSGLSSTLSAELRAKFVPSMRPILDELAPLPANPTPVPGYGGNLVYLNTTLPNLLQEDTGSIKIDYVISSSDRLNVRYNINDSNTENTFGPNFGQVNIMPLRTQFGRFDYTRVFSPTLLNQFGLAINRTVADTGAGLTNLPIIQGFFTNLGSLPGQSLFSLRTPSTSFQILESLTKTTGRHTWRFGMDLRKAISNKEQRVQQTYAYGSFADLANNVPFALTTQGYPMIGVSNWNHNFYVQDDWKVTNNFTLNVGVRYEYNTVLRERHNRLSNFDVATQKLLPGTLPPYEPDHNNFAPRVGFAWDVFGSGVTVVRGFGGIFYLPFLTGSLLALPNNDFPSSTVTIFDAPIVFPTLKPPQVPGTKNVDAFARDARDTYSPQWTFGVQQQIAPATVLEANYVGNRGVHLPAGAAYAGLQLNYTNPFTGQKPYPNFGNERLLGNFLQSSYHALQTQLRRRSARTSFDVSYTWSHEIDNAVNIFGAYEDPSNYNLDRSDGDIDIRHVLSGNFVYTLPELKDSNRLTRGLLGGWQASSLVQARSGNPVNVVLYTGGIFAPPTRPNYVSGQSLEHPNAHAPDRTLNPAAYTVPTGFDASVSTIGNLSRNSARGTSFFQWDFSGMKHFQLTEAMRLQLRGDIFNILNHPNFSNPDSALCSSVTQPSPGAAPVCTLNGNFGRIGSTIGNLVGTGTSRQVQFALKLIF